MISPLSILNIALGAMNIAMYFSSGHGYNLAIGILCVAWGTWLLVDA